MYSPVGEPFLFSFDLSGFKFVLDSESSFRVSFLLEAWCVTFSISFSVFSPSDVYRAPLCAFGVTALVCVILAFGCRSYQFDVYVFVF